ncbi:MAG TPA: hypothetical protein VHN99_11100, partial [Deinococcales bacterium]|nr:hypothetical protein [Deinococcales bacterium]
MRFDRSHFHHLRRAWIAAELGADPRAWAGHGCGPRHVGCGPSREEGRDPRSDWRGERGDWREG